MANSGWEQMDSNRGGGLIYHAQPGAPDDVVSLDIDGEAYPRIVLDPNNGVLIGDGTAPPIPITSFDPSGFVTVAEMNAAIANAFANVHPFQPLPSDPASGAPTRATIVAYDGAGHLVTLPPTAWITNQSRWASGSGGSVPMAASGSTSPAGTNAVAYTATMTATGGAVDSAGLYASATFHAGSPASWMTLTLVAGGATLTGTAETGTYSGLVVRLYDLAGYYCDFALADIVITGTAQPFAINLPNNTLPAATVGSNYSVNIANYCSNPAGAITVGYGSPVQLPNHGIDINYSNGSSSAGYIGNKRTLVATDAQSAIPAHFAVSDGTTTIQVAATVTIQATALPGTDIKRYVSNDYNKATGTGTYAYTTSGFKNAGDAIDPWANAQGITADIAALVGSQGRLYCSVGTTAVPAVIPIGAATGASTWPAAGVSRGLIHSGSDATANSGLNNWDIGNVLLTVAPGQPVNGTGGIGSVIYLSRASAPVLRWQIDGNGANQNQAGGTNRNGTYFHGYTLYQCGAGNHVLTTRNVRGVTGSSGHQGATGVGTEEVFAGFHRFCAGGDVGTYVNRMPDGSGHQNAFSLSGVSIDPSTDTATKVKHGLVDGQSFKFTSIGSLTGVDTSTTYYVVNGDQNNDTFQFATATEGTAVNVGGTTSSVGLAANAGPSFAASGTVWQATGIGVKGRSTTATTGVFQLYAMRHGMGMYNGGNMNIAAGSVAVGCQVGFNIEAGDPMFSHSANVDAEPTGDVAFGTSGGATNGQIYTARCDIGLNCNGNNQLTGANGTPTKQILSYTVWGHDSSFDTNAYVQSGHKATAAGDADCGPTVRWEAHHSRVNQPISLGMDWQSTTTVLSGAQSITYLTSCSAYITGSAKLMNAQPAYDAQSPSHGQFTSLGSAPW